MSLWSITAEIRCVRSGGSAFEATVRNPNLAWKDAELGRRSGPRMGPDLSPAVRLWDTLEASLKVTLE